MRSTHVPALLALVFAACACVTQSEPVVEAGETTVASTGNADISTGRLLQNLDSQVDRFVYLQSQPGESAHTEQQLLGTAIEAQVAQHIDDVRLALADADAGERQLAAAKALAFSDAPGVEVELATHLDPTGSPRLLTNVTFSLARIQSHATPTLPLIGLIDHADVDVRSNALLALWHVVDARRRAGMVPLDPTQQNTAGPALEAALFDPNDAFVRAHAAAAVGAIGDPQTVDSLINLLRDTHPFVRTHTALALGKLGDLRAIPALVTIIDETQRGTPRSAVIAGLSVLVEKSGRSVPDNLGESERAWKAFLRERLGPGSDL